MDENECTLNQSVDQEGLTKEPAPHKYDILPHDSIRILSLLPGNTDAPLQCELHRADVPGLNSPGGESGPTFEALSYTWGDGNLCQRLFCNTSVIKITQSLFDALIHLRHLEATRMLWVDAVCIDQNNNDEKIVQLPYMKDIYQHANQVVIWLGLADESTSRALDLIRLAAHWMWQESGQSMPRDNLSRYQEPFSDDKNRQRGFPPLEDLESWPAVVALFTRSWFSRCWTFQEAVLATKATVQIGAYLLDWADLSLACTFFQSKSYGAKVRGLGKGLQNVCRLCWASRIGREMQKWKPMPLILLLTTTSRTRATIPKDRIFGVLALTDESTLKYFSPGGSLDNPKYKMSVRELYTDVSRFLLQAYESKHKDRPFEILNLVKHYPIEEGEQEKRTKDDGGLIPSWVKRWHDPITEFKMDGNEKEAQPMNNISKIARFRTGGPEYHAPEYNYQTPYEISLHGFMFAPISNNVNILRLPALSRPRIWDLFLEIHGVREGRYASYPTGESIDEVFALTLTMAQNPQFTHGAETYHAIHFQHFCVSLYEMNLARLKHEGRIDDIERFESRWQAEYERLRSLVGTYVVSPTFWPDSQQCCRGRKLFSTLSGHIGIGDGTLESGDLVCVFLGGLTPFIIRPVDQKYKLVGECYVHGIMHGEALEEGLKRRQLITLI